MIIENNWLKTNIKDKSINNRLDYKATIVPYTYTKCSFKEACEATVQKISMIQKPIFIGFSGGSDSEYVVRLFHKLQIPFTAVTVITGGNDYELEYAYRVYREFPTIKKVFLDISEPRDIISKYADIVKTFNTAAINSVGAIEAARYAKQNNGIMISGDHFIGYDHDNNDIIRVEISEWDAYYDVLVGDDVVVPFYAHNLSIAHSIVSSFNDMLIEDFKEHLYELTFRPKFKNHFETIKMKQIILAISAKTVITGNKEDIYTKDEFLSLIT